MSNAKPSLGYRLILFDSIVVVACLKLTLRHMSTARGYFLEFVSLVDCVKGDTLRKIKALRSHVLHGRVMLQRLTLVGRKEMSVTQETKTR